MTGLDIARSALLGAIAYREEPPGVVNTMPHLGLWHRNGRIEIVPWKAAGGRIPAGFGLLAHWVVREFSGGLWLYLPAEESVEQRHLEDLKRWFVSE